MYKNDQSSSSHFRVHSHEYSLLRSNCCGYSNPEEYALNFVVNIKVVLLCLLSSSVDRKHSACADPVQHLCLFRTTLHFARFLKMVIQQHYWQNVGSFQWEQNNERQNLLA